MIRKIHLFILIFCGTLLISSSCNRKEGCTNPKAENFDPTAEREDGSCIGQRAKFIGLYEVTEICGTGQLNYLAEIKASNVTLDEILIFNFPKDVGEINGISNDIRFENPVVATIVNSKFTFDRQMPDGDGWYIQDGKGTINGNEINMSFRVKNGNGTLPLANFCTSLMVK
jgi:hypothetical protein